MYSEQDIRLVTYSDQQPLTPDCAISYTPAPYVVGVSGKLQA